MTLFRAAKVCAGLCAAAALTTGCQSASRPADLNSRSAAALPTAAASLDAQRTDFEQVAFDEPRPKVVESIGTSDDPFSGQTELQPDLLVDEVLARNPSLVAMIAAWRAAAQRYPQVVSLDDPMFGFMLGPDSWGSDSVESAYMLEASQKLPWPGKRDLRGRVARAEAAAARLDIADARLRLSEAATLAFLDYYLVRRELELNDDNARNMQEFRDTANAKYQTNLVTQQDVLQADVELADLKRRRFELDRMEQVAVARINTLLHRQPDVPLPDPPARLATVREVPPVEMLREFAIQQRPDLAASAARIRAEQAAVALAAKEYYPDLEFVGRYDAFWQADEEELRPQVGMNVNLPVFKQRRAAAVREARYKVNQRRAELEGQLDAVRNDVHAASARIVESRQVTELYAQTLLPIAEQNVESARSDYVTANVDFLRLIEAQKQLIELREKSYEAEVDYHRRFAELERLVGAPLGPEL